MSGALGKLKYKIIALIFISIFISCLPVIWFSTWQNWLALSTFASLSCCLLLKLFFQKLMKSVEALNVGLLNFKDGDFSNQLAYQKDDEFGELCRLYNETAQQLRKEKQWLYQREMMLDKMLQSAPQALLLINDSGVVVFANQSAQNLVGSMQALEGLSISKLQETAPQEIATAINCAQDGLISICQGDAEEEIWHASVGEILLNNQHHNLYIFKQLTRELNRQEVAVWKKVIRIISHELNNSLGPISSMSHSGKIIATKLDDTRLHRVFSTIDERITHLTEFVQGYGTFAKLPMPSLATIEIRPLLESIQLQWPSQIKCEVETVQADKGQLEQLIINLLKNAHESGSEVDAISLTVVATKGITKLLFEDGGQGMSETVLTSALVPFYSTKNSGTGLGLALCREIVEAHNGYINLSNRPSGGLCVEVGLPS
ncbi:histidine kinase [Pseudoalteromonas luteoviolacea]|uniref:histidine kinase n=1 Tax=Pseudoalteromonas luteoviolacea TaxID=43657 RepID=A0A1C0TTS4_9GAMM|nr:ATP-binding protein [Pseudoalteromonas luteoviolacea]OCQ22712.1 histidine kinase [Pseudoalteromonas luteoviolacea]